QGTFIGHFDFHIAGEFTTTPAAGSLGALADAYVIADYLSFLKIQVGQFDAPFTLENRTSDKYLEFVERGASVRYLGVPANKELGAMAWGWLPKQIAYYSIGLFNGDGQNFKNQDNWGAVLGRAFVAPVAWLPAAAKYQWMREIEVGASFWWQHEGNLGGAIGGGAGGTQNDLAAMSTTGGFGFFSSNYNVATDGAGNNVRAHLVPSGGTTKWAVEARVPIWNVGLQSELIHVSEDLLSYYDSVNVPNAMTGKWSGGSFARSAPKSGGNLDGYGGYIEAFAWILGDASFIERPGVEPMPHIKKFAPADEPRWGLRVLARYEQLSFHVTGLPGIVDPASGTTTGDAAAGLYKLHQLGLGLDAWGTKHVRLTVNYFMNYIDGDAPLVKKNFFYQRAEHELLFRVGINL
ncbi:MAG: OprO/OprP family phosphate-selective porin, partial [Myxococcales bacterium]|nr:OprO/OprP family phosphate-selective porin [Myxococcales bacterium]